MTASGLDDAPYALGSPEVQARRRAMLSAPHTVTLERYVERIRDIRPVGAHVPSFDPRDGGDQERPRNSPRSHGPRR